MKNKINYYIVALFLLFYPLFSYAQSPEGDEPSLEDTLKWISDNLINHKFKDDCRIDTPLHGSNNYSYSHSVIKSCEIVIAEVRNHESKEAGNDHWKYTEINKFSGNLGNIRSVGYNIPNSCRPPSISIEIKEESPFKQELSITYYPTNPYITNRNQNRVETSYTRHVTMKFNSLDKAKSFQKAFVHAANLCSKQEKPKSSLF